MITVAALSPALDMTYVVDELVLGRPHRPTSVVRVAGGKALNSARAAARLGADVTAVPVLGGHIGSLVSSLLQSDGVRSVRVTGAAETRICVTVASEADASLTEVYEHPVPLTRSEWAALVTVLDSSARPGSWVSISGGLPPGAETGLLEIARLVRSRGARLALDTHGSALSAVLDATAVLGPSAAVALLKVNREEAAEALSVPPTTELSALVECLRFRTGGRVVVTDGAAGSLAADDSGPWQVRLPSAEAFGAHPVGSGDSYLGGLLAALDAGADLPSAVALAAGAAAANALVPGAAVFDATVARSLAARVEVTRA
jgi:1-phosphofructokinase family hexose kinase